MSDQQDTTEPEPEIPPTRRSSRWLILVGCGVGAALFATLQINACARDQERSAEALQTCTDSLSSRAYIRIVLGDRAPKIPGAEDLPAPGKVLPILDCQASRPGHRVRLSRDQEDRYLDVFRRGRLPIVDGGRVVGSQPFPVPPPSKP
jgi:hypothetical protein